MLKTRVKANQITNLTDARYFAAWEVEWLGFNFNQGSDNYIQPQIMKAIKEWVEGPKMVGEFSFASSEDINTSIDLLGLDGVQVGMFTELNVIKALNVKSIIKEIVFHPEMTIEELEKHLELFNDYVEFFVLNFDKNSITWEMIKENQTSISQEWLARIFQKHKIMLSGNFDKEIVLGILEIPNLHGISVTGGEEEMVGVKSFDELDEIFEVLEILV